MTTCSCLPGTHTSPLGRYEYITTIIQTTLRRYWFTQGRSERSFSHLRVETTPWIIEQTGLFPKLPPRKNVIAIVAATPLP